MRILLIEDDYMQAEWMSRALRHRFKSVPEEIATEHEFRQQLERVAQHPPDVILMDAMLQWTTVSDSIAERPAKVEAGGKYRAGFRCLELLAARAETKNIPVVLYSAMGKLDLEDELQNLPPHVKFVLKDSDLESLIDAIRELLNRG